MVTAPARRLLVRSMVEKGLSERRALTVVRMSASALRYEPRPDNNVELREQIAALAHRHRRYGVGMIHLKLRQKGLVDIAENRWLRRSPAGSRRKEPNRSTSSCLRKSTDAPVQLAQVVVSHIKNRLVHKRV